MTRKNNACLLSEEEKQLNLRTIVKRGIFRTMTKKTQIKHSYFSEFHCLNCKVHTLKTGVFLKYQ